MREVSNCGGCNHLVRNSFPSEQNFEEVELEIQRGFSHQQTIPGGISKPKHEFLGVGIGGRTFFGAQIYTCEKCKKEWELSIPDMAYRGYFKPIEHGNQ
jgi:hypothetical protein